METPLDRRRRETSDRLATVHNLDWYRIREQMDLPIRAASSSRVDGGPKAIKRAIGEDLPDCQV
jgi:hypothetical protein